MATPLTLQELYDENFYRSNYPELANLSSRELSQHFLTLGITEQRRFSPFFNLSFYQTSNTNLNILNSRQLVDHFLNAGLAENRKFSQFVDLDFYRTSNPDLARIENVDLFRHLRDFGLNEKRSFSPYLDIKFYRDNNPSLAGLSDRQLLDHFEITGVDQALTFSPFFDINFFRNYASANSTSTNTALTSLANLSNRQLFTQFQLNLNNLPPGIQTHPFIDLQLYRDENPAIANLDNRRLFQHLQTNGLAEERTFSYYFDNSFYRINNPDLGGLNNRQLWEHFLTSGAGEGRYFSPFIDLDYYRSQNSDLANLSSRQLLNQLQSSGLNEGRTISPFFDLNYYKNSNSGLATFTNRQAWQHLQTTGIEQGLRFSAFVDLDYYRSVNPDLGGLSNIQLFEHLQTYGINEGRAFSPVVDLDTYRNSNPQLGGLSNRDLFEIFINSGISGTGGGNSTTQFFDPDFYRRSNPDLAGAGIRTDTELLQHFQNFGLDEERKFSPYLDLDYYLKNNPDLAAAGVDTRREAFEHFQRFGLDEGRLSTQFFDVKYYLDNNPDLRRSRMSYRQAFAHFQNFGIDEGRRPSLLFNPTYYLANNPDLAARRTSFREAFKDFQLTGFQLARPASIFFNPDDISPVISPNPSLFGEDTSSIPLWLQNAAKWGDIPANGTLSYSFVTTASAFLYEGTETGVSEVSDAVKNNIRNIMRQYDDVLGINLVEVPDRPPNVGRIRIMYSRGPSERNLIGYGNQPSDSPGNGIAGDIHLDPTFNFAPGPGSFSYEGLLFVVGAALGLDDYNARRPEPLQPQDPSVNPLFPFSKDNNTNTVMTQNFVPGQYNGAMASTPMPYDIRALQYLYGASYLNNGDTTYSFNFNNFFGGANERNETNGIKQTIWDAGGIDTLDFSAMPANGPAPVLAPVGVNVITPAPPRLDGYYLDMNEGGQLTTLYALNRATYLVANTTDTTNQDPENPVPPTPYTTSRFNTNIAFGFELENLIGTPGIDVILGNNLPNNISGGAGDDNITGAGGADRISGGPGNDIFVLARGDGGPSVAAADVITDFTKGEDKIGLALGLPFGFLGITQGTGANASDTLIRLNSTGEYLAVLTGVSASAINISDFVSV